MVIEVNQLSFQAESKKILQEITLHLPQGKMIGIIGANGSGKTTLLKHLCRKLPSHNKIYLEEKDIATYSGIELAQKISLLSQLSENVEKNITINQLVMMGRYPYKKFFDFYNDQDKALVKEAIKLTGLTDNCRQTLAQLSGGERQRALIARALAQKTSILFLDEPTNHLDIKYKREIMNILKSIEGTVVLTLHDLNLAFNFCDLIIGLKNGRVVDCGKPEELVSSGLLENLYEIPFQVKKEGQEIWIHY